MPTCLNVSFFETNRKQTTCTNKFSICLPREQFFLGTVSKQVRMSPDVRQKEMCVQLRIFHLKQRAQNEQAWFKQESRKDNLGNKPQRLYCFLRFAGAKVGT